jgi:riboflavin synthase
MFSGIIEELGRVSDNAIATSGRLEVAATAVVRELAVGDSVAVNGCCLTVVEASLSGFAVEVMPETARRTNLEALRPGDPVNLEASMTYGARVGGHLVSGHIDAAGTVVDLRDEGNARWVTISAPQAVMRYIVAQGCVAVDGISLTVVDALADRFTVSLIPHTVAVTGAEAWKPGAAVNLEADLIAKYVERSLTAHAAGSPG